MRIVVLTSETPANSWLVSQILSSSHDVAGMVIERPPLARTRAEKSERRRRMRQRHGVARTVNKLLYNWLRSRLPFVSGGGGAADQFFTDQMSTTCTRAVPSVIV